MMKCCCGHLESIHVIWGATRPCASARCMCDDFEFGGEAGVVPQSVHERPTLRSADIVEEPPCPRNGECPECLYPVCPNAGHNK